MFCLRRVVEKESSCLVVKLVSKGVHTVLCTVEKGTALKVTKNVYRMMESLWKKKTEKRKREGLLKNNEFCESGLG